MLSIGSYSTSTSFAFESEAAQNSLRSAASEASRRQFRFYSRGSNLLYLVSFGFDVNQCRTLRQIIRYGDYEVVVLLEETDASNNKVLGSGYQM